MIGPLLSTQQVRMNQSALYVVNGVKMAGGYWIQHEYDIDKNEIYPITKAEIARAGFPPPVPNISPKKWRLDQVEEWIDGRRWRNGRHSQMPPVRRQRRKDI